MRVLSNLAVKKLCFCSLLFPSAGRKWNIAGTNTLVLCEKCRGSSGNESACSRSFNNKEDYPIRIYSALKINADYTITRNRKDFYLYDSLFRCVGTGRMILVKLPSASSITLYLRAETNTGKRKPWKKKLPFQISEHPFRVKTRTSLRDASAHIPMSPYPGTGKELCQTH